jgi:hypothetical protein
VVAGEQEPVAVEQRLVAGRVARRRTTSRIVLQPHRLVSLDDALDREGQRRRQCMIRSQPNRSRNLR